MFSDDRYKLYAPKSTLCLDVAKEDEEADEDVNEEDIGRLSLAAVEVAGAEVALD